MSILTNAPSWFIILCVLCGLIYTGALYFRDRFNTTFGPTLTWVLGALRFSLVTLLAFFLLRPLIKYTEKEVEKPIIVLAQDNSQSLIVGKDSSFYKGAYLEQLRALKEQFGENYEIQTYRFGAMVNENLDSTDYSEKLTDFSNLLNEVHNKFSGRNLGAVVIASDGLYNKGKNPIYSFKKLNVPVYTIALGDTTVHRDVLIADVVVNRLAYLGNQFPVRMEIESRLASGQSAQLTVSKGGRNLYSENITFSGDRFFKTVDIHLPAEEIGLQKYTVQISAISDEVTTLNNRKDFFIDVLDGRQKVLILGYSPHPDIAAMRSALENNESYQVEASLFSDFKGKIRDYSLVIYHQLPGVAGTGKDLVKEALSKNIPALFIWGANTDFTSFNELNVGYSLRDYRNGFTDISGILNTGFNAFIFSETAQSIFKTAPPLSVPFGEYAYSPGVTRFVNQRLGTMNSEKPLISFNKVNENRVGLIAGEGIWRWRMNDFQVSESHEAFNEMMTKMAQYLASKEDRSYFRISGKNDFPENEPVIFRGELYNESYEPLLEREIAMSIRNEDGKEFVYTFSPDGTGYRLNVGQLPVGNYRYEASASPNGQVLKERGEFSVSPLLYESLNTIADHRLMYQLANDNGGTMVYPNQMNTLVDAIQNKKEIVPISYENKSLNELINFKWLLIVIIVLLGGEWLLRKRAGGY